MTTPYGLQKTLDIPYETAIEQTVAALKKEGFGILTQIDVKATLKEKLDVDFRRYIILGACNPPLAYQAFQRELEIGLLLPCNVIVYETEDGRSVVSIADPLAMMEITQAPLQDIAQEARPKLSNVLNTL